ncbi:MAG: hypothetical protein FD187_785 [bacterium]|nr:MAG: hypothetical protein FD142_638 [bacterium]KAF0149828.1 MAG: hypothetical protein FD187_785 [bacterium]KAF0168529.1 MAG: hypothetical protein FD158_1249 [bacterium]TXT19538.1 MAG: hypothetical protein FD132_1672 [bacterium]
MTLELALAQRLRFLARVVHKESRHLATTDQRLFASAFTIDRARQLETDPDLAERVEAFVGRIGRLQDTLGDKLLPALLAEALQTGHEFVAALTTAARIMIAESERRIPAPG